jgi:hypothetical protein
VHRLLARHAYVAPRDDQARAADENARPLAHCQVSGRSEAISAGRWPGAIMQYVPTPICGAGVA